MVVGTKRRRARRARRSARSADHYREMGTVGLLGNSSRSSRRSFAGLLTLFEPVTLAVHFQDMDMVSEPIEQGSGKAFGAQYLGPFVERKIAGNQRGAALVTLAEDLKQEFGGRCVTTARSPVHQ